MILITIYCHITKKINIIASIQDKNKYSTFKISKRMVLQCINGVGSNPAEGRTKI